MNRRVEALLLCAVLAWALGLRVWRLDAVMFRVDEAESTINALTILQHGYPTDHYLGLPLYENTLTLPWPESAEYEFKDSSYSARGMAIYHGWLPLYAIAASLEAFGIAPNEAGTLPAVQRTPEEMARLTRAARAPAVVFGMMFLLVVFALADELYGRDAAWGALLAGAFSSGVVEVARQARYYALATLLTTACCLFIWRILKHGRWRDYLLGAVLFALLFHTHVVAFAIAGATLALVLPFTVRRPGAWPRMTVFSALVAAAALPWAWLSGFLDQASRIPRAWPMLRLPEDLWAFLELRPSLSLLLLGGAACLLVADAGSRRLPARLTTPLLARRSSLYLLVVWMLAAYLGFTLGVPAVSYSLDRMAYPMLGPGMVLAATFVAAAVRMVAASPPPLLSGALLAAYLALFGNLDPLRLERERPRYKQETIEFLRSYPLRPDTRVYATPNLHLFLSAYTGLPVQNVAPVRRTFLDSYPGEVLLVEVIPFRTLPADVVQEAARAAGVRLDRAEARRLAAFVTSRAVRERLRERVAEVDPPLDGEAVPDYLRPLIDDLPRRTEEDFRSNQTSLRVFPAMFRGFGVRDWTMWWSVYFYRFVDPEARMGTRANYASRLARSRASVLASGVTVYQSPAGPRPAGGLP